MDQQMYSMNDSLIKLYAIKSFAEIGPKTLQALLIRFGSPQNILEARYDELIKLNSVTDEKAAKIISVSARLSDSKKELELIQKAGIGIISILDTGYPAQLLKIGDPPPILFYKGKLPTEPSPALAVVGTTKASDEGISIAVSIGKSLADKGIAVISGLAAGIDSSAHIGTLKNGGFTVGVLGSGLLHIYPKENQNLSKMIQNAGCMMSEYHPETRVSVGRLISRNRIIVGLASAVIVVEISEESSGTLNAIARAREQGKNCYLYDPNGKVSAGDQTDLKLVCFKSVDELKSMLDYMIIGNNGD
ncbi:MAG: hypothetical protein CO189_11820 [candidate division Zixibacteria bacterium CG_4_9_14_3_um_filter_46_8]|nr:MAG: hypothetical protein CO189_11820 [candidate division Zixibacteria bacterium CG_4_9_14_3_um_filter_46_8]